MKFVKMILLDLFGTEILSNLKCKRTVWSIKGDHITREQRPTGAVGAKPLVNLLNPIANYFSEIRGPSQAT